jgi:hypothetical protein
MIRCCATLYVSSAIADHGPSQARSLILQRRDGQNRLKPLRFLAEVGSAIVLSPKRVERAAAIWRARRCQWGSWCERVMTLR